MFPYVGMMVPYTMMPHFGWWIMPLLLCVIAWEAVWKGIGLWKAGRNNQLGWFIAMLIINSVGILPIIYIVWFQKKQEQAVVIPKVEPKKKAVKKK